MCDALMQKSSMGAELIAVWIPCACPAGIKGHCASNHSGTGLRFTKAFKEDLRGLLQGEMFCITSWHCRG